MRPTEFDYSDINNIETLKLKYGCVMKESRINESMDANVENAKMHIDFKRLIFIEKAEYMEITTFEDPDIKIDFIPADTCAYTVKNGVVHITDVNDKNIEIKLTEFSQTVIYCKCGYLDPVIVHLLNLFMENGFLVLNNPNSVNISSNKYLTAKVMTDAGVNQPNYCLVKASDCAIDDNGAFDKKLKEIYGNLKEDNKYVCKILDGHGGNGVFICTKKNILSILQCVFSIDKTRQILIQQALKIKDGDIRVYLLTYNGKQEVVECITRKKNSKDFRTNICLGSTFEKFELTKEQEAFAKKAAIASGLTFAGVDMCIDENTGKLNLIEINGAPGAPVALNIDKEQNHKQHVEYYQNFINILKKMLNE